MIERCPRRVDSSAQRSRSPSSPARARAWTSGCSSRWTIVQPRAANRFDIEPRWTRITSRATPRSASAGSTSDQRSTIRASRSSTGGPARRSARVSPSSASAVASASRSRAWSVAATSAMSPGWTKASDASRASRAATSAGEALAPRRVGAGPRGQPQPVAEAPGQREDIDLAGVAELGQLVVDGAVEGHQVGADVLPPEEVVGERAAAVEQLGRQLAQEHLPVGHALAGVGLGQGVEGPHPGRREHEEVLHAARVDDEGVADAPAGVGHRGDHVGDRLVPRQGDVGPRRAGVDGGRAARM